MKTKQDIFDAINMHSLPQEEQEEFLIDLQSLVYKNTLVRLIERMDEATKEDFNTFLTTNPDEDAVLAYIYKKIPDADALVDQVIAQMQNDILLAESTS